MTWGLFVVLASFVAFIPALVVFLSLRSFLASSPGLLVGVAEVGAVARGEVSVPGGQVAASCGRRPVCSCFLAVIVTQASRAVALLGEPVSLLSTQIPLIGAFDEDLDVGIGLDGVQLVQDRFLVALTLIVMLLAPVGCSFSLVVLSVTPIGRPVTPIGRSVAPVGHPIPPVRCQVPVPASIALIGDVVALIGRAVARFAGAISLRCGVVTQVRGQVALLLRLLTLLRRLRGVIPTLGVRVGLGSPQLLRPFCGDPVTLVGNVVALVSDPVPLLGNPVALISHVVTLVGAALAFLGLARHRASLPQPTLPPPDVVPLTPRHSGATSS